MTRIIGDVHGKIHEYMALARQAPSSIAVGDMLLGWSDTPEFMLSAGHAFFRGNHDNPSACRNHPNYLGDYGYCFASKIYWISGADSIDKLWRKEGRDWFPDEELDATTLDFIVGDVMEKKPDIILSHDCPQIIAEEVHNIRPEEKSRTRQALDAIFEFYQPKLWIYGHHHISYTHEKNGTTFRCLAELEAVDIIHHEGALQIAKKI